MSITIRRAALSDLDMLRDLAERTFRDAWQEFNEPERFEDYCREHFAAEKLYSEWIQPGTEFYLAFIESKPIAYLKLNVDRVPSHDWDDSPGLQLERIYVHRDAQSRGLGAGLLRFTEQRARDAGAAWLWLTVWQESPRSISFYEKNGFSIFGVETFWLGNDPQADWLMRKKL